MLPAMSLRWFILVGVAMGCAAPTTVVRASKKAEVAARFDEAVKPILAQFCYECHNEKVAKGDLNLAQFDNGLKAIEAADVALMSSDLTKIVEALELARQVRGVSRQNVVFSIALLGVLIPAALLGALGVAATVVAHEVGELIAVANGLRAGRA